jgi:hypothetical protein
MQCSATVLECRLVPRADCFAQPAGWRWSVSAGDRNAARKLKAHEELHSAHVGQEGELCDLADKLTRTGKGYDCSCGASFESLGYALRHKCRSAGTSSAATSASRRRVVRVARQATHEFVSSGHNKKRRGAVVRMQLKRPRVATPVNNLPTLPPDLTHGGLAESFKQNRHGEGLGSLTGVHSILMVLGAFCYRGGGGEGGGLFGRWLLARCVQKLGFNLGAPGSVLRGGRCERPSSTPSGKWRRDNIW